MMNFIYTLLMSDRMLIEEDEQLCYFKSEK
jgi:hypothetical protein